jgi:hypothetical protein
MIFSVYALSIYPLSIFIEPLLFKVLNFDDLIVENFLEPSLEIM